MVIDDPSDARLDPFRDLNSVDRRPDRVDGKALVIAEGTIVVRRMVQSRFAPIALLGVQRRFDELADVLCPVPPGTPGTVPFLLASAEVMAEAIGFHLNRGVLAAARRPEPLDASVVARGARSLIVLEGVNDHENIGSIFRNAAGLGVDAVVFGRGCADPLYRRSVRVSMGHALRVPFAHLPDWPRGLDVLREQGFRLAALTPAPDAVPLAVALAGPPAPDRPRVALLVGAEGPGLTHAAMSACDVRAAIPMAPGTDSLNVATAAAIAFYELGR